MTSRQRELLHAEFAADPSSAYGGPVSANREFLPQSAVLSAPAKLTVELRITGVRDDGMHLLDAEMVSLDFGDTLTLSAGNTVSYRGLWHGDGDDEDLVTRALRLIRCERSVVIDKAIPAGAGLGGGSADAAAILRAAGFYDLDAAARLGADVPYCLVGGRARVSGIGEVVVPLPDRHQTFTLVTPPLHCSTPAVYRQWDKMGGPRGDYGNDLEPAALALVPELARYRDQLSNHAGARARLAGSGSTWFVEGAHPGEGYRVASTTTY